ncbi:Charged multivesicular body protein 4b [Holothuria leucospilota]|uniref:Charged multivesicular body protein 4b n=1 Tax=Holothuria leucospilota TaxID=206669 RepID=A0A9Q1CA08_HOLLE|nr:Charged multivesicular body protein 4b [Holothuria leucospilota]
MSRFFGGKKKEVGPSSAEGIQKLRETEELLTKKQEFLEKQIADQVKIARQNAASKNKRAALNALKKKKRLEKNLQQIDGTLSTIEFQREALENANTNTEVLKNMGYAAKALKSAQTLGVEDVDDMMADIQEQMELANEISQVISEPQGFGQDVDEDELLAELEELEQEEFDQKMLDVDVELPELPEAPSEPIAREKKKEKTEDDDLRELEAWAT